MREFVTMFHRFEDLLPRAINSRNQLVIKRSRSFLKDDDESIKVRYEGLFIFRTVLFFTKDVTLIKVFM